ncbi:MAG TPA: HEAT repeat domain-containing protein [Phycisphaerae bacterium]|nr:HEAT repeat domain-containing protein [Phycisphaerae bacterium]
MASKNDRMKSTPSKSSPQETTAGKASSGKAPAASAPVSAPSAVAAAPVEVQAAAPAKERDRSGVVALIGKLRDQDAEVARDAAAMLGTLPVDADATAALAAVLVNSESYFHPVVRAAAAAALGALRDSRAIDALIRATGDSMAEASEEAIKALGSLGDRRALPALERVIRNDNGFFLPQVQRAAGEAVRRIAGQAAGV